MLQRAMKLSSDELFEANQRLRDEAESLKDVNKFAVYIGIYEFRFRINFKSESLSEYNVSSNNQLKLLKFNKQREELLVN
jgi:hypothetical protein